MIAPDNGPTTINAPRVTIEPFPKAWRSPLWAGFELSIGMICGFGVMALAGKSLRVAAHWLGLA